MLTHKKKKKKKRERERKEKKERRKKKEEEKVEQSIDMKLSKEKWPNTRVLPSPWGGAHPKYPNEYNNARRKFNKDIANEMGYLNDVTIYKHDIR